MIANNSEQLNLEIPMYYKRLVQLAYKENITDLDLKLENEIRKEEIVLEKYWIIPYFTQVCIVINPETNRKRYLLLEPVLSEDIAEFTNVLYSDMKRILAYKSEESKDKISEIFDVFEKLIDSYSVEIDGATKLKIIYYLIRNFLGFGVIDGLINDNQIEDISCDGYGIPIYIFHRIHGNMATNIAIPEDELDYFVLVLCQKAGKFVSHANPLLDATLPDGSRLQVTYGSEIAPRGTSFTIRKFRANPLTPIDLMRFGTMNAEMIAYFWMLVENKMNFMVIGETASGKTTTLNALMMFIPPDSKVVSIEDTREIALMHENWIAEVTKVGFAGEEGIEMYDLLRAALRQRPEYIIVGEVRGREALTLFQAMSTGHATYATLHAGSVSQLIYRLENEPLNVPRIMIQFLDSVVVQTLWIHKGVRKRRAIDVSEIFGVDPTSKEMLVNPLFRWNPYDDSFVQESDSKKLEKIANLSGKEVYEVIEELKRRAEYLRLLDRANVSEFKSFVKAIQQYYSNPDKAFEEYGGFET